MNKGNEKAIRPQDKVNYLPGNDSIRPGEIVGLVGGDWSKGIQDHVEQIGPFPSDSRLRHFVRHEQPPTMSNAEAISILKNIETDIYGRIAISKAIDALRSPWVKTADRLPDKCDDTKYFVLSESGQVYLIPGRYIKDYLNFCPWWATTPPLPEDPK